MPTYAYKCECGEAFEEVMKISDHKREMLCKCGKTAKQMINFQSTAPTFTERLFSSGGYYDKSLNVVFNSPEQRRKYLKQKNIEDFHNVQNTMSAKQERLMMSWRLGERQDTRRADFAE